MFKAERLLESLLKMSGLGICIVDYHNKIIEVNDTCCQIYEYEKKELINQSFSTLKPDNFRERAHLSYQRFIEGGSQNNVTQILTKKGNRKSVHLSISEAEDEDGHPLKVYSIVEVGSFNTPSTQKEGLPKLADSVTTGILRITTDGSICFANPHARRLLYLPAGIGQINNEVSIFSEQGTRKLRMIDLLNEQRFLDNEEVLLDRAEHAPLWLLISATTVMDNEGEVCFDVTLVNLENQKLKERKLKKKVEELKATNQHLDHFVFGATHDLKAPLASLSGLLQIMRIEPDPEQKEAFIQMMEKSINRLNEFIREIVDYSRNANQNLKSELIDFEVLINEVFESMEHMEKAAEIEKSLTIDQSQPFYTDTHRLKVVLNNLISNAHKYSSTQRRNPFIRVSVRADRYQATIKIEDNGQGIDQKHIEKIFEMFFRATDGQGGSGLGLYIVKETLDKLKGTVHVVSELSKGTSFVIHLPSVPPLDSKKQLDLGFEN